MIPQASHTQVNIVLANGVLRIVPDTAHVSRNAGNSVLWHCVGCTAQIIFEKGSPFLSDHFEVPAGGFVGSGPAFLGEVGHQYKYRVVATELYGGRRYDVDPHVVVDT